MEHSVRQLPGKELGSFLRRTREALAPAQRTVRRRTPGLRREEVAEAAGISTTWYTWLEQGRDVQLSLPALERLSKALRLDATGRRYLLELARPDLTPPPQTTADPALRDYLDALEPFPAYAIDRGWNFLAHNAAAGRLLGLGSGEDNLLRRLFLDAAWRRLFVDWNTVAAASVGQFRVGIAGQTQYRTLIDGLAVLSPEFAAMWSAATIAASPLWIKRICLPDGSRLAFSYAAMQLAERPGVTLSIYAPADEATRTAIAHPMS